MITFQDGPAKNQILSLARAPQFLRVVEKFGKFDALDQIDDTPSTDETIYAYEVMGVPGCAFVDGRDPKTGKRFGHRMISARYSYLLEQPDDAVMRDTKLWQQWCIDQSKGAV